MKITKIDTVFTEEFGTISWVRIHTDSDHIGLGETSHAPRTVTTAIHELFSPILIGENPIDRERLWQRMFRIAEPFGYAGAEFRALSAIDIALWDLAGQSMGEPIYNLLGGMCRDRIRIYNTNSNWGDIRDKDMEWNDPVGLVQSLLDEGITMVKVYYSQLIPDNGWGDFVAQKDLKLALEPLEKIRNRFGDEIDIAHDGWGRWSLPAAIKICRAMEDYDIFWQEEMMRLLNAEAHLRLKQSISTPIAAAERLIGKWNYREYLEKGALDFVMPDLNWNGGITETKKLAALAETYQTPITLHDFNGPVQVLGSAHVSLSVPNMAVQETSRGFYKGWYDDVVDRNVDIRDGYLYPPEGPGLGTALKPEVLDRPDAVVMVSDEAAG